jgi:metal-responsive CopG/Arc/MetJ family transcriptional regulator
MVKKVIQVPMDEKLLKELNKLSQKQKKSRSEFIREACASYVAKTREAEADRKYIEGYRKFPETTEMGEIGMQLLAQILPDEEW